MEQVRLAYGRRGLVVSLPQEAEVTVIRPRFFPGVEDEKAALRAALRHPIASPPLRDLVSPRSRVAVVFSDVTRAQPRDRMLPVLLNEIGIVPPEQVLLINALGTHRPGSDEELRQMVGDEVFERYRIVQHDCNDREGLTYLGDSSFGHQVWVNSRYMEADVRILTGFIEPHLFAGFSGGPKAVLPGIAGADTILDNHSGEMLANPKATWGVTTGNPLWEEMLEAAQMTAPNFVFNVTMNRHHEITGVFAGALVEAHAAGVEHARQAAMVAVEEPFDVALTTNAGYPLDINLYQSVKGISAAAQVVRPGGAILIASECREGVPAGGNYATLLAAANSPQALWDRVTDPGFRAHDQWEAFVHARLCLHADIYIYSEGLSEQEVSMAMLYPCHDIEATLHELVDRYGPRLCVLPEGPMAVPYVRDRPSGQHT